MRQRVFYSYSCTAFDIAAIREMQDGQNDGSYLKKDGSNFVNVFYSTMSKEPEFKNRYLSILSKLISDCEDICISEAGGKQWMNLHPAWQKLLASEILRCKSFKQCFISTHSPNFLDEFTEGLLGDDVAVFVFAPSGKTSIRKLDKDEMTPELENWTLGDLYRIGAPIKAGGRNERKKMSCLLFYRRIYRDKCNEDFYEKDKR